MVEFPDAPGYGVAELDHSRHNYLPPLVITIQIVTTLLLWIRLVSRLQRTDGRPGVDDILIFIAWVLGSALTVIVLYCVYRLGFDRHVWDVSPTLYTRAAMWAWTTEHVFLISTCLTKLSVLMFYRRLVEGTLSRLFKFAVWAAMAVVVLITICFPIALVTTCSPIEAAWMQHDGYWLATHTFHCHSTAKQVAVAKLAGSLSVITDFYSVMLPAMLLLKIKINMRQKIGLLFIFGMGYMVVGAGIARTFFLGRVQATAVDKMWAAYHAFAASIVECNLAIVCACAPSIKALTGRFFRDRFTTRDSSKDSSNSNSTFGTQAKLRPIRLRKPLLRDSATRWSLSVSSRGFRKSMFYPRYFVVQTLSKCLPSSWNSTSSLDEASFKCCQERTERLSPVQPGYDEKSVMAPVASQTSLLSRSVYSNSLRTYRPSRPNARSMSQILSQGIPSTTTIQIHPPPDYEPEPPLLNAKLWPSTAKHFTASSDPTPNPSFVFTPADTRSPSPIRRNKLQKPTPILPLISPLSSFHSPSSPTLPHFLSATPPSSNQPHQPSHITLPPPQPVHTVRFNPTPKMYSPPRQQSPKHDLNSISHIDSPSASNSSYSLLNNPSATAAAPTPPPRLGVLPPTEAEAAAAASSGDADVTRGLASVMDAAFRRVRTPSPLGRSASDAAAWRKPATNSDPPLLRSVSQSRGASARLRDGAAGGGGGSVRSGTATDAVWVGAGAGVISENWRTWMRGGGLG